jgi:uncharacterized OB-fold protein
VHKTFPLPDLEWEPTLPFWTAAARGELAIPLCPRCGEFVWYPRPHCGGDDLAWEVMSGRATLFAWSVVRHPFLPQFRDAVPFVPALVALEEDPAVRVVTRIVDCDPEGLRADQPVRAVFRPLTFAGVAGEVVAPLFVPA